MPSAGNDKDSTNGWEAIAKEFISIANRDIGADIVETWTNSFRAGQSILDVGCGFGGSYTQSLIDNGVMVFGIDASKTLIKEHKKRFPEALVKCEAAEDSSFFDKEFDGALSVGLIFLLSGEHQIKVLQKMANALKEEGRILFTSPCQKCEWDDLLTGKKSLSLGRKAYMKTLHNHGLRLVGEYADEGGNHYYDFQKKNAH